MLDVAQLGFDLLEDRQVLLALEGLGAHVGLVLVVGAELAHALRLRLVGEVLGVEGGPDLLEPHAFLGQPLPRQVGVH